MGKGDNRRPRDEKVSDEEYGDRWAKAFGKPPAPSREAAEAPKPGYQWAVYFRYASEQEQLAGEFERRETANVFAGQLRSRGAATRVERMS